MDDQRFDSLARLIGRGASRRAVFKGLFGIGGATLAGGGGDREADARTLQTRSGITTAPPPTCLLPNQMCGGECCEPGHCKDGHCCQNATDAWCGGQCWPAEWCTSNGTRCGTNEQVCGSTCCPSGTACARDGNQDICCDPETQFPCGLDCCDAEHQCCDRECCGEGSVCLTSVFGGMQHEEQCCPIEQTCDGTCCDGTCFWPLGVDPALSSFNRDCCPEDAEPGLSFCPGTGEFSDYGACCAEGTRCCTDSDGRPFCIGEDQCCQDSECADDPAQCLDGYCDQVTGELGPAPFVCASVDVCVQQDLTCCPGGENDCYDPQTQCCTDTECSDGLSCTDDVCDVATHSCSNPEVDTNCNGDNPCYECRPECAVSNGILPEGCPEAANLETGCLYLGDDANVAGGVCCGGEFVPNQHFCPCAAEGDQCDPPAGADYGVCCSGSGDAFVCIPANQYLNPTSDDHCGLCEHACGECGGCQDYGLFRSHCDGIRADACTHPCQSCQWETITYPIGFNGFVFTCEWMLETSLCEGEAYDGLCCPVDQSGSELFCADPSSPLNCGACGEVCTACESCLPDGDSYSCQDDPEIDCGDCGTCVPNFEASRYTCHRDPAFDIEECDPAGVEGPECASCGACMACRQSDTGEPDAPWMCIVDAIAGQHHFSCEVSSDLCCPGSNGGSLICVDSAGVCPDCTPCPLPCQTCVSDGNGGYTCEDACGECQSCQLNEEVSPAEYQCLPDPAKAYTECGEEGACLLCQNGVCSGGCHDEREHCCPANAIKPTHYCAPRGAACCASNEECPECHSCDTQNWAACFPSNPGDSCGEGKVCCQDPEFVQETICVEPDGEPYCLNCAICDACSVCDPGNSAADENGCVPDVDRCGKCGNCVPGDAGYTCQENAEYACGNCQYCVQAGEEPEATDPFSCVPVPLSSPPATCDIASENDGICCPSSTPGVFECVAGETCCAVDCGDCGACDYSTGTCERDEVTCGGEALCCPDGEGGYRCEAGSTCTFECNRTSDCGICEDCDPVSHLCVAADIFAPHESCPNACHVCPAPQGICTYIDSGADPFDACPPCESCFQGQCVSDCRWTAGGFDCCPGECSQCDWASRACVDEPALCADGCTCENGDCICPTTTTSDPTTTTTFGPGEACQQVGGRLLTNGTCVLECTDFGQCESLCDGLCLGLNFGMICSAGGFAEQGCPGKGDDECPFGYACVTIGEVSSCQKVCALLPDPTSTTTTTPDPTTTTTTGDPGISTTTTGDPSTTTTTTTGDPGTTTTTGDPATTTTTTTSDPGTTTTTGDPATTTTTGEPGTTTSQAPVICVERGNPCDVDDSACCAGLGCLEVSEGDPVCDLCLQQNDRCRHDSSCCSGLVCRSGECRFASCRQHSDCFCGTCNDDFSCDSVEDGIDPFNSCGACKVCDWYDRCTNAPDGSPDPYQRCPDGHICCDGACVAADSCLCSEEDPCPPCFRCATESCVFDCTSGDGGECCPGECHTCNAEGHCEDLPNLCNPPSGGCRACQSGVCVDDDDECDDCSYCEDGLCFFDCNTSGGNECCNQGTCGRAYCGPDGSCVVEEDPSIFCGPCRECVQNALGAFTCRDVADGSPDPSGSCPEGAGFCCDGVCSSDAECGCETDAECGPCLRCYQGACIADCNREGPDGSCCGECQFCDTSVGICEDDDDRCGGCSECRAGVCVDDDDDCEECELCISGTCVFNCHNEEGVYDCCDDLGGCGIPLCSAEGECSYAAGVCSGTCETCVGPEGGPYNCEVIAECECDGHDDCGPCATCESGLCVPIEDGPPRGEENGVCCGGVYVRGGDCCEQEDCGGWICGPLNECVECETDVDCTDSQWRFCNSSGDCTECRTNEDCRTDNPCLLGFCDDEGFCDSPYYLLSYSGMTVDEGICCLSPYSEELVLAEGGTCCDDGDCADGEKCCANQCLAVSVCECPAGDECGPCEFCDAGTCQSAEDGIPGSSYSGICCGGEFILGGDCCKQSDCEEYEGGDRLFCYVHRCSECREDSECESNDPCRVDICYADGQCGYDPLPDQHIAEGLCCEGTLYPDGECCINQDCAGTPETPFCHYDRRQCTECTNPEHCGPCCNCSDNGTCECDCTLYDAEFCCPDEGTICDAESGRCVEGQCLEEFADCDPEAWDCCEPMQCMVFPEELGYPPSCHYCSGVGEPCLTDGNCCGSGLVCSGVDLSNLDDIVEGECMAPTGTSVDPAVCLSEGGTPLSNGGCALTCSSDTQCEDWCWTTVCLEMSSGSYCPVDRWVPNGCPGGSDDECAPGFACIRDDESGYNECIEVCMPGPLRPTTTTEAPTTTTTSTTPEPDDECLRIGGVRLGNGTCAKVCRPNSDCEGLCLEVCVSLNSEMYCVGEDFVSDACPLGTDEECPHGYACVFSSCQEVCALLPETTTTLPPSDQCAAIGGAWLDNDTCAQPCSSFFDPCEAGPCSGLCFTVNSGTYCCPDEDPENIIFGGCPNGTDAECPPGRACYLDDTINACVLVCPAVPSTTTTAPPTTTSTTSAPTTTTTTAATTSTTPEATTTTSEAPGGDCSSLGGELLANGTCVKRCYAAEHCTDLCAGSCMGMNSGMACWTGVVFRNDCVSDADCPAGFGCSNGACYSVCTAPSCVGEGQTQCAGPDGLVCCQDPTPMCDSGTGDCVQCLSDTDCGVCEMCDAGVCVQVAVGERGRCDTCEVCNHGGFCQDAPNGQGDPRCPQNPGVCCNGSCTAGSHCGNCAHNSDCAGMNDASRCRQGYCVVTNGIGSCAVGPAPIGTLCRTAQSVCDDFDTCNGTDMICPPRFQPRGTFCSGTCKHCDGFGDCVNVPRGDVMTNHCGRCMQCDGSGGCEPVPAGQDPYGSCPNECETCNGAGACVFDCRDNDGVWEKCCTNLCEGSCNPDDGTCTYGPLNCNDNDPCTTDTCEPGVWCKNTFDCTNSPESCCDDGDPCTVGTCEQTGQCTQTPVVCDDGNACTVSTCIPGVGCTHTPIVCNDNNPCTTDTCDPATGCVHSFDCRNNTETCCPGLQVCNTANGHCQCLADYASCNSNDDCCSGTCADPPGDPFCGNPSVQRAGKFCLGRNMSHCGHNDCCLSSSCQRVEQIGDRCIGPGGFAASSLETPIETSCAPGTCESLGIVCGTADDGCGGVIDCGACCTPRDYCNQGECGVVDDGCGGVIDCGACVTPAPSTDSTESPAVCKGETQRCVADHQCCDGLLCRTRTCGTTGNRTCRSDCAA